jgi:signal transduction histidine kinase
VLRASAIKRVLSGDIPLTAAVVAGFVLLFVAAASAVVVFERTGEAEGWVQHSLELRSVIPEMLGSVEAATVDERGYLLTGDRRYLAAYQADRASCTRLENVLDVMTRDNLAQQMRVHRLGELDQTLGAYRTGGLPAAVDLIKGQAINGLVQIRAAGSSLDESEAQILVGREFRAERERERLSWAIVASLAAAAGLSLFVIAALRRSLAKLSEQNVALALEMQRREATEAQLRQAQKMDALGRLTGGIAHDFNNMLAIVIGNLDMLARRLPDTLPQLKAYAEHALEGARRGAALTKSLLAYTRQQPLAPRAHDVNRLAAETAELLRRTLGERIRVETDLADGVWPVFIDGSQLESAIVNLAVNARDAMPEGGVLTIETSNADLDEAAAAAYGVAAGQYVVVALTDTGTGMSPEVMSRAFDPFFTTKPAGAGTGLGLSQVEGFVRQSKGYVKIYSEPDRGTTVRLYLPPAVEQPAAEHPAAAAAGKPERPDGAVVLVVEDDSDVRSFVRDALRDLGYGVVMAEGLATALGELERRRDIALLLTDVIMPDASGRLVADAVRARRPELPVVFMSGYARNAIVHNGMLDSDADLLSKPFTLAELSDKVSKR